MRAIGSILGGEIHCTRMSAIQGDVYAMDDSGRTVDTKSSSVAELTLKETLCLNFTVINSIHYLYIRTYLKGSSM